MFILGVLLSIITFSMIVIAIVSGEWAPLIACAGILGGIALLALIVRVSFYVIPDKSK